MLIRPVSDIHTEFLAKDPHKIDAIILRDILPDLETDTETTLILAGDIGSMHKPKCLEAFIDHVAARFQMVLYIPGNHEAYGGNIDTLGKEIGTMTHRHENVIFGHTLEYGNIFGCTLWTDFYKENPTCMNMARGMMNDYRLIEIGDGKRLTPEDTLKIHKDHLQFLDGHIREGDVIFTHHLPSFQCVDPKYKGDELNGAYASDLDDFIIRKKPKLWISGHSHDPIDMMIGDTRILRNPRGYVGERGIDGYKKDLVIEV